MAALPGDAAPRTPPGFRAPAAFDPAFGRYDVR